MTASKIGRQLATLVGAVGLVLAAAACGTQAPTEDKLDTPECADFKEYTGLAGKEVSIYSPIRDVEADLFAQAWKPFEDCTGVKIQYEGSGEFETQLNVRVDGGRAPDIAFVPQPGFVEKFANAGKLKPVSDKTKQLANDNYPADVLRYGTVNGTLYGAPMATNVKSFVWYSPTMFKEKGWTVPQTWDQLIALSDTIAATGIKPWCAGIESGVATGWPATDWVEDLMLRKHGPDVYDQWVKHQIPFNDPRVAEVLDLAGTILKSDKYVNGGYGDVKSIATTAFQDGGVPIREGKCALHRQASFYANFWPDGTNIGVDADVFAAYFPAIDPAKKPVLIGGEYVIGFADRPEVQAFQSYLASTVFVNARAKLGNWVSANNKIDPANVQSPIDKLSGEILGDPNSVLRFDGSDLMPSAVGNGTFWKGMTDWITGQDTKTTVDFIEGSWPK